MGYSYSISPGGIPIEAEAVADIAITQGIWKADIAEDLARWMYSELNARLFWTPSSSANLMNPWLKEVMEGEEPSYDYTDRCRGMLNFWEVLFSRDPYTRRGFWPVFVPEDSLRAPRLTRIPCTIGYQPLLRDVDGQSFMHMTYLQRSCDYSRFWISDVWFASMLQRSLVDHLKSVRMQDVSLGSFTHFITSFHNFEDQEIY